MAKKNESTNCGECSYFEPLDYEPWFDDGTPYRWRDYGYCVINAPKIGKKGAAKWPRVYESDFCGRGKNKRGLK